MKTRFSAFLLFVLMAVEMNAQNYTYQYEGQPITLTAVDPIQLFARGGDRDQNITDTGQVTRSVALSEKLWMMIDQGLAPLSVIYRTFGAFPRTLIIKSSSFKGRGAAAHHISFIFVM